MAKSRRVTFELPPASHRVLEQAAEDNGINVQAALARRVSGLVPKRPAKAGSSDKATAETTAAATSGSGRPAAADATPPLGFSESPETE